MRKVVAIEGKPMLNGRLLLNGSLEPAKDVIPVTCWMAWSDPAGDVVGRATDFQRDSETGRISFEIEFSPRFTATEREMMEKMDASVYCRPFKGVGGKRSDRVITKATVLSINLDRMNWGWRESADEDRAD